MPKVYIIVVSYNGMKWLDRCLGSLRQSAAPVHTIVVDNASTDGTPDYIEHHFPEVELIRSSQNHGFGKGNNVGLKLALNKQADYAFLLNQDAWIIPDTIATIIQVHVKYPEYGVLSPVHLNAVGDGLETKFEEYASPGNTPGYFTDLYMGRVKSVYTTQFVNAAAWLISLKCLQQVGGFNPLFPHYGEDEDFINRCKYHNFKIGIAPKTYIFHDGIFDWPKIEFDETRNLIFNLIPLTNINHRNRSAWLLFIKRSFDELSTNLLFRKYKKFKVRNRAFWKTLFFYKKVRLARAKSIHEMAFLD